MNKILFVICLLLGLAILPMPYGYYTFLRITVCIYGLYLFFSTVEKQGICLISLSGIAIAILYNPVFKIYFKKGNWSVINIVTILLLLLLFVITKKSNE